MSINRITLPKVSRLARFEAASARLELQKAHYATHRSMYAAEPSADLQKPTADQNLLDLQEHLQGAIMVELSTVPCYLYAMYSIMDSADPAVRTIRNVVVEEMLHMVLAGNTLCATGMAPKTYPTNLQAPNDENFPVYPMVMSERYPYVRLTLRSIDERQRQLFIDIERRDDTPQSPQVGPVDDSSGLTDNNQPQPEDYQSLGDFYRAVQQLINSVVDSDFNSAANYQITSEDNIYWGPGLVEINSPESANAAMQVIIDQGEGATEASKDNHLYKFQNMQVPAYGGVYNARSNPHTNEYKNQATLATSEFFDAAYGYLLLTIQQLWVTPKGAHRTALSNNIYRIMMDVLRPVAQWLFRQPYNDGDDETAGPCFDVYPFRQPYNQYAYEDLTAAGQKAFNATISLDVRNAVDVVKQLVSLDPVPATRS